MLPSNQEDKDGGGGREFQLHYSGQVNIKTITKILIKVKAT